ncbi:hypothetical protein ABAC460_08095 [Asticcacaulis sp. AC460]|nr:hypothetical protein ABAC460_08095 [Asticcacaulis sp. AC460]
MQQPASFSHEAVDTDQADRTAITRKAPAYADRWWFTEDGLRLYARDYAASAGRVRLPVICLHGVTRNSADFEEVAPYISRLDRRVIVPDLRGRGLSEYDANPANYHLWTYAKDVLSLCDALGIGRAIFVGSSMGGLVTMVLSTLRPNLVVSAVLNDVGPVLSPKGLARLNTYAAMKPVAFRNWHDASVFVAEQNKLIFPNYTQAEWLKLARRAFIKNKDGLLRLAYDPRITETFRSLTVASANHDLDPCYASLAQDRRILLVRGALSDVLGPDEVKTMAARSRNFIRVDIDYVGHAPQLTEPQAFAAVCDFLEGQA